MITAGKIVPSNFRKERNDDGIAVTFISLSQLNGFGPYHAFTTDNAV
jgi:hypothetical protein